MTTERFSGLGANGSRREVSVSPRVATLTPYGPLGRGMIDTADDSKDCACKKRSGDFMLTALQNMIVRVCLVLQVSFAFIH